VWPVALKHYGYRKFSGAFQGEKLLGSNRKITGLKRLHLLMQHTPFQDKYDTCEKKRKFDNFRIKSEYLNLSE